MLINDLKRGMKVSRRNIGDIVTINDNKKGMIREIHATGPLVDEIGSEYVFNFHRVLLEDGKWELITMTEQQKKQAEKIKIMMGVFLW